MGRRGETRPKALPGDLTDPEGLTAWVLRYLEALAVRHRSPQTVTARREALRLFLGWCEERGLTKPQQLTRPILQRYQRHLFYQRRADGTTLSVSTQHVRLVALRGLFQWLTRENVLGSNPASDLELPRKHHRLPRQILTPEEVEALLSAPDLEDPLGVRDRAILELFWSTGIRRMELAGLRVFDLVASRGILRVHQGKGGKERVVPVGERAIAWCLRYLWEVRPSLVVEPDPGAYFLTREGEAFLLDSLSGLVRGYLRAAGLWKGGSCHLLRHSMATAMLENGADVRYIQEMLGHAELTTTQIYTHVSIRKLQEIHAATHPGARQEGTQAEPADAEDPEMAPGGGDPGPPLP